MFESSELYFVPPSLWEDPYENVLIHKRSHAFLAQCWCKKAVSDAMWRIYSPDRTALRIRTSRAKLTNALQNAQKRGNFEFLVHDVEYMASSKVKAHISRVVKDLKVAYEPSRAAEALLVKRDAFDHEYEVRVLVHDTAAADKSKPKQAFRIPVDPHTLIESVCFDPRADVAFVRMCTHYLTESLKFNNSIRKSGLYRSREPVVIK